MENETWGLLQIFGQENLTGESAADPGQQRLMELGVPARLLEKRAEMGTAGVPGQDAAAAGDAAPPGRMTWEEIMADPEYNRQMQAVVRARLKEAKESQAAMEKLAPGLEALARQQNMDPGKPDYDALARAMEKKTEMDRQREEIRSHFRLLQEQSRQLRQQVPDFDLATALQDPDFLRMTAPGSRLTVEEAYYLKNREKLQSQAVETATRLISNHLLAAQRRPEENGISSQAPSVNVFDYRSATAGERAALKKRILTESAQGRKVYPGI